MKTFWPCINSLKVRSVVWSQAIRVDIPELCHYVPDPVSRNRVLLRREFMILQKLMCSLQGHTRDESPNPRQCLTNVSGDGLPCLFKWKSYNLTHLFKRVRSQVYDTKS